MRCTSLLLALLTTLGHTAPIESNTDVVFTSTNSAGQIIDWIKVESQDDAPIAAPLAAMTRANNAAIDTFDFAALVDSSSPVGPSGTVPVVRCKDTNEVNTKAHPPSGNISELNKRAGPTHWYAGTRADGAFTGIAAKFSMYDPCVAGLDFSLLRTFATRGSAGQTVEAGWATYPTKFGTAQPVLFTFFTTNNYGPLGDYAGGWNQQVKGWVQVDRDIYPGMALPGRSIVGVQQNYFSVRWELGNGNWWLNINNRAIGYYPSSLFTSTRALSDSLASHADQIHFFGEVYDATLDGTSRTDMGSGVKAFGGWTQSASLSQMKVRGGDQNSAWEEYASRAAVLSDPARYDVRLGYGQADFAARGNYMFVGGGGFGGTVNAGE